MDYARAQNVTGPTLCVESLASTCVPATLRLHRCLKFHLFSPTNLHHALFRPDSAAVAGCGHCPRPPLAAAPAAAKKAAKAYAAAPASASWNKYSATSKQSAQFEAVQPQGDVSFAAPADIKEAAAYAVAEIVAEATGSEVDARNAAEVALED